jgi:hypothetical protein
MLVKVEFASFAVDPGSGVPFIILKEAGGPRTIPVRIGPLEASAIAVETLKVPPLSPLMIDVAKNLIEKLDGTLGPRTSSSARRVTRSPLRSGAVPPCSHAKPPSENSPHKTDPGNGRSCGRGSLRSTPSNSGPPIWSNHS